MIGTALKLGFAYLLTVAVLFAAFVGLLLVALKYLGT